MQIFRFATLTERFSLGLLYSFSGSRFLASLIASRCHTYAMRNHYAHCTALHCSAVLCATGYEPLRAFAPSFAHTLLFFTVASHDLTQSHEPYVNTFPLICFASPAVELPLLPFYLTSDGKRNCHRRRSERYLTDPRFNVSRGLRTAFPKKAYFYN